MGKQKNKKLTLLLKTIDALKKLRSWQKKSYLEQQREFEERASLNLEVNSIVR